MLNLTEALVNAFPVLSKNFATNTVPSIYIKTVSLAKIVGLTVTVMFLESLS